MILEPVNIEGSDAILYTATGVHAAIALNATTLPPPLSQPEDSPLPSSQAPPPLETNEVLTDLVNLLCQQNDRLARVENDAHFRGFSVPRSLCVNCWLLVNDWSLGLGMYLILWISCNVSKSDNCNKQN